MKLGILAEIETNKETIESLVHELLDIFPPEVKLEVVDLDRYDVHAKSPRKKPHNPKWMDDYNLNLRLGDDFRYRMHGKSLCNKIYPDLGNPSRFYFNVSPTVLQYPSRKSVDALLIISHRNHVYFGRSLLGMTKVDVDFSSPGDEIYSAISDKDIAVIGIPNEAHSNHSKLAAHEVAHMILDPHYGQWIWDSDLNGQFQRAHCKGIVESSPCLMNPPKEPITKEKMDKIYLGFCNSCYDKLKIAGTKGKLSTK